MLPVRSAVRQDDSVPRRRASAADATVLTRQRVLRAALDLLDREGVDALTMRNLAREVGASPMSLYGHVADRQDVLDGVYELMLQEIPLPVPEEVAWQEAIRASFRSYRQALLNHPHATAAVVRRPASGRSGVFVALMDASLGILRQAGLEIESALHAQRTLTGMTIGLVIAEINLREREESPGTGASVLLPAGHFPYFIEALPLMLRADFGASFEAGVDLVIEAIEQRLEAQKKRPRSAGPR